MGVQCRVLLRSGHIGKTAITASLPQMFSVFCLIFVSAVGLNSIHSLHTQLALLNNLEQIDFCLNYFISLHCQPETLNKVLLQKLAFRTSNLFFFL